MTTLLKTSLSDQIVAILQERIIAGEFAGDDPLRQDELAAEFGVSKIPMREAFTKLEQTGLVTSQANRGFFVSPLSPEEASDVFDLRLRIEPEATARAAVLADAADQARARQALALLDTAAASHGTNTGLLNRNFHLALIRPAPSPVSLQILERLHVIAERYVVRHLTPHGRSERASLEHQAILEAWTAGDAGRVADLVHRHIAAIRDDLLAEFALVAVLPENSSQRD